MEHWDDNNSRDDRGGNAQRAGVYQKSNLGTLEIQGCDASHTPRRSPSKNNLCKQI